VSPRARRRAAAGGGRARRVLAQAELRDADLADEERLINLEVELSFSAGMAASAGAVAWSLYEFCQQTGVGEVSHLLYAIVLVTIAQVFALALALHLVYRGVWIAARLHGRSQEERWQAAACRAPVARFRRSLEELDRVCGAVFFHAFRYLYRGALVALVLGALLLAGGERGMLRALGSLFVGGALFYVLALLAALALGARRVGPRVVGWVEAAMRALGLWWVATPIPQPAWERWRSRALLVGLSVGLFFSNLMGVSAPRFESSAAVYSRARDRVAELRFGQGGLRGHSQGELNWDVRASFEPAPRFVRLGLSHYVAVVPLAELEPGVHWVEARLEVVQHSRDEGAHESMALRTEPARVRFLVRD